MKSKIIFFFLALLLWSFNIFLMYEWRFKPVCNGELIERKRSGQWLCYDGRGNRYAEFNYKEGKKNGLTYLWYPNGSLDTISTWTNGMMEGDFQSFHQNGKMHLRTFYRKGQFHGKLREWDPTGQIITDCNYVLGQRHGLCQTWYENGQLASEIYYERHQPIPPIKFWDEDGVLQITPKEFEQ